MPADEVVRARVEPSLKRQAMIVLAEMGLSMSDVIRMLLMRVASERALPFEVRVPNEKTMAALDEAKMEQLPAFRTVSALMKDLDED
jgi:DNA-damage-inducible protein J